jgi:hypothetical protein
VTLAVAQRHELNWNDMPVFKVNQEFLCCAIVYESYARENKIPA